MPSDEIHDMNALAAGTQDVYERLGPRFDAERHKHLVEGDWLRRFESLLPGNADILDLGCGAGEPVAKYLIANGHNLTGIDYSSSMIRLVRQRFPAHDWREGDMRALDLDRQFDGILSWHAFFHLTPDEQRLALVSFADHLRPTGALMLTVGTAEGEVVGHVGGEAVYHSSLSPDEYREILTGRDVRIVDFVFEDPECDMASVLLAQKR